MNKEQFQKLIWSYYREHGRELPWRKNINPYRVLVSEIMLQQTQADRVIPKYKLFLKHFPTFAALAKAPQADVLKAWSGLGYNRRALALKKITEIVVKKYKGRLPNDATMLDDLPGIGPATAASIAVYAYNLPVAFIETNVRSVYIHFFFRDKDGVSDAELFPLVEQTMDKKNPREWFYALMDYGVKLKKEFQNPSRQSKHYTKQSRFEGSNRQLRGKIIKLLLENPELTSDELSDRLEVRKEKVDKNLEQLEKEGFKIIP